MCGIAGIVTLDAGAVGTALRQAQLAQAHRGPDGADTSEHAIGRWRVGLGHQRLSIIDLSDTGRQPMQSHGGRHWLTYNGEVYNYVEIRERLARYGHTFRGSSDSEVILTALETQGEAALGEFNGMWSFAWLDVGKGRLVLCRDRLGVKPLYVYMTPERALFASEIKTILAMSGERFALNDRVIASYARQSLLETTDETFFTGIVKVPPGCVCVIELGHGRLQMRTQSYWSFSAREQPVEFPEAVQHTRELLVDAVRIRLRSDVPVGVLLSGGVDSSAIASCMQRVLGPESNLNLLSAVSDGGPYDESPFIDTVARALGRPVNKVRLSLDPERALSLLDEVCYANDEPVGSFSNVAHYLLMKQARELGITVVLSGQGADEIYCGYKKFLGFYLQQLGRAHRWYAAGRLGCGFLRRGTVLRQFSWHESKRYLPAGMQPRLPDPLGDRLRRCAPVFAGLASGATVAERQLADLTRFSVPVLTHYEDRMSMAWGCEVRTPFLDYRLVQSALAMPMEHKLGDGWTKRVLRAAVAPMLPAAIAWRKDKQGFVNPQSDWLKAELRSVIEDLLARPSRIFALGLFDRARLAALYRIYCSQRGERGGVSFKDIFQPLALEVWLNRYEYAISG